MNDLESSSPTITQETYKGWKAWRIQQGCLVLMLVPQVGGRVMSMQWRGHDLSFTQPEREGTVVDVEQVSDLHQRKREMGFPLWGGEKTWLAPQSQWTDGVPFLDLDSGPYEFHVEQEKSGNLLVRMASPICRETGIQITRTLTLSRTVGEWTVTHHLQNKSDKETAWGVWNVAMLLRPATVYIPTGGDSPYPEGIKTFDEEGASVLVREKVVHTIGKLAAIRCEGSEPYKFGVDSQNSKEKGHGWMLAVMEIPGGGLVGYQKEVPVFSEKRYGHGCLAEVYNSDRYPYFEMEIHGPLVALQPQQGVTIMERQSIFDVTQRPQIEEDVHRLRITKVS